MAIKYMTGETCGNGEIFSFIADDTNVTAGDFYQLGSGLCVEITDIGDLINSNPTVILVQEYASCADCLAPITANTRSDIPIYLNSEINNGGDSAISYSPPNPVWTNGQNHAVVQANMVTLGGNGLNS